MAEAVLEQPRAAPAKPPAPKRTAPIVPERSVAGRTLVLLIAIMTFLSGVTLGGVVLVQKSAIAWSSDVGREVTIQIRPVEGEVMDSNIRTAIALAEATPGVSGAHVLSLAESQKLLEPWLGAGLDLSTLEIPRLVVVELGDPTDADLTLLARNLATINGASLDTHAAWRQQLNVMAGTIVLSGVLVLALIVLATVLAVVFATRGTMASNREIIEVLHFVGANERFISREFERHFLGLGVRAGLMGAIAAAIAFLLLPFMMQLLGGGVVTAAETQRLIGSGELDLKGYLLCVLVVIAVAGICMVTSRVGVIRVLKTYA